MTSLLRKAKFLALLSCGLIWEVGAAQAHIGNLPAGITPFYTDGEFVGAATNLGLVGMNGGTATWYTQLVASHFKPHFLNLSF